MRKTKHQPFEYREIPRSTILGAPYNPRVISSYARKLLKDKIERAGCVEALVWNEMTCHLVSGHQRLAILDELEGSTEYLVGVTVIRVNEKREKEINIFLNNTAAQGHFDEEAFAKVLREAELALADIGMTKIDFELEFGTAFETGPSPEAIPGAPPEGAGFLKAEDDAAARVVADVEAIRERKQAEIDAIKQRKKEARLNDRNSLENDADYMLLVAFESRSDKEKFLRHNRFAHDVRFLASREIEPLLQPGALWRGEN